MQLYLERPREAAARLLPGLALALAVALAGLGVARLSPALDAVTATLIIGMLAGNLLRPGATFSAGVAWAEKHLLEGSVVLLGLGVSAQSLLVMGGSSIGLLLVMIAGVIVVGLGVGRLLGLSPVGSLLCAVGCAICGSTAIAATAPALRARKEEIGLAVGAVNLAWSVRASSRALVRASRRGSRATGR